MIATDHKWLMGSELRIPTIEEIEVEARSLLVKAVYNDKPVQNVGTGGLLALKLPWGLYLCFQLTWTQASK